MKKFERNITIAEWKLENIIRKHTDKIPFTWPVIMQDIREQAEKPPEFHREHQNAWIDPVESED